MNKRFYAHFSHLWQWKASGAAAFYLLPTVEAFGDRLNNDFGLSFSWLFWSLTFANYQ